MGWGRVVLQLLKPEKKKGHLLSASQNKKGYMVLSTNQLEWTNTMKEIMITDS